MAAGQHILPALTDAVHYFFQDGSQRIRIIIDFQRLPERHGQKGASFFQLQSRFVKGSPEATDNHRYYNMLIVFDDVGGAFSSRSKGFGSALGECDHPAGTQRTINLAGVRRVEITTDFFAFLSPGALDRYSSGEQKKPADPTFLHGFFSGHIKYVGKGIEQVDREAQFILSTPFYCAENMEKGDNVSKIGLVIADEEYVAVGEIPQILRSGDFKAIYDRRKGIGSIFLPPHKPVPVQALFSYLIGQSSHKMNS